MIKIFINNKILFVPKNITVLEACEKNAVAVPRFCYHERLSIAGNCRMCLVEIEKITKPIASCTFPVSPNMKIYTNTPLVEKARENILEFLLMHHPLDCPICDQGGECDLQDQTLMFGSEHSRYFLKKRSVEDKACSFLIKTIMTRCIHCTRCVRFFQDIIGEACLGTTLRGQKTEIGFYIKKKINMEFSGNIIDLCPVGALTAKVYAFTARPWELKAVDTVDCTDSIGANIKVNFRDNQILRILPLLNDSLNEEWISDKTRFSFDGVHKGRLSNPFIKVNNQFIKKNWVFILQALIFLKQQIQPNNFLIIAGNSTDSETVLKLKKISKFLNISLLSESYIRLNQDLMPNFKLNSVFTQFLDSDLCLTLGTNMRFEASLLNLRIKKQIRGGLYTKLSIGYEDNALGNNLFLGNSINSLISIAEGRNAMCKTFIKAKNPLFIIGYSIQKRLDSVSIKYLINDITKYSNFIGSSWLGINFLPTTANFVAHKTFGVQTENKISINKKKIIFFVGMDSFNSVSKQLNQNSVIFAQTTHFDSLLNRTNGLLPSTSVFEKEATYINLEGRIQTTAKIISGPTLARDDSQILKTIFFNEVKQEKRGIPISYNFSRNSFSFIKRLAFTNQHNFFSYSKFFKTSFKNLIPNFYCTTLITKNSLNMIKCFSLYKKNYLNFLG